MSQYFFGNTPRLNRPLKLLETYSSWSAIHVNHIFIESSVISRLKQIFQKQIFCFLKCLDIHSYKTQNNINRLQKLLESHTSWSTRFVKIFFNIITRQSFADAQIAFSAVSDRTKVIFTELIPLVFIGERNPPF